MNGDIRISVNFVQHPKTKKTIRKYGHAAIVSIIALEKWRQFKANSMRKWGGE